MKKILADKKIAVLVDTEYIHEEVEYYNNFFTELGAQVDFISFLFGQKERKIIADITDTQNPHEHIHTMTVDKDFDDCNPNAYAIILVAANYVACRLREIMPIGSLGSIEELNSSPAVRFFASAMMNPKIVKGALCHALWLLTPVPELLKGRKVICHTVVLADIHNAGGVFVPEPSHVVVDRDLVTARSVADIKLYADKIIEVYKKISNLRK